MTILKNKLKILEQENQETLAKITSIENKKEISNMFRSVPLLYIVMQSTLLCYIVSQDSEKSRVYEGK